MKLVPSGPQHGEPEEPSSPTQGTCRNTEQVSGTVNSSPLSTIPIFDLRSRNPSYTMSEKIEICNIVERSGFPNYKHCRIPIETPFNIIVWEYLLQSYHDAEFIDFVTYGWPINYIRSSSDLEPIMAPGPLVEKNHTGAVTFPGCLDEYVPKQLQMGAVLGPFSASPFSYPIRISPLNTVDKPDSDERRVIMDCSFPPGSSVNDNIPKGEYLGEDILLKYPTVDSLAALIVEKGKGCKLFKRDLKSAYRNFRIDPRDVSKLCFMWRRELYADSVLAMGLRSSAYICQRITDAVSYIYRNMGFSSVNYQDDFGCVEYPELADAAYHALGQLLAALGLPEALAKAFPPATAMRFLGIWFDSVDMTMSIDNDRLDQIKTLLHEWQQKQYATRKDVERLVGLLNFVAKCVRPGRVFMARMFDYLAELPPEGTHLISDDFKLDVAWWGRFLPTYNGVSLIPHPEWCNLDSILETDACLTGAGAVNYAQKEYFHLKFPDWVTTKYQTINELELLTILIALRLWGSLFQGFRIKLMCDNMTAVSAMRHARIRNANIQALMREIVFLAAVNEFEVFTVHIPGVENRLADYLSRIHLSRQPCPPLLNDSSWVRVPVQPHILNCNRDWN